MDNVLMERPYGYRGHVGPGNHTHTQFIFLFSKFVLVLLSCKHRVQKRFENAPIFSQSPLEGSFSALRFFFTTPASASTTAWSSNHSCQGCTMLSIIG